MNKSNLYISLGLGIILFNSCRTSTVHTSSERAIDSIKNGINYSYMDKTVRPQDDFYNYVNGSWQKNTVIPAHLSAIDVSDILTFKVTDQLIAILHAIVNEEQIPGSDKDKIKKLYFSYLNVDKHQLADITSLSQSLKKINAITTLNDLQQYLIGSTQEKFNPLYNWSLTTDHEKNNVIYLKSPLLGLDNDYYDLSDPDNRNTLVEYERYIEKIFTALGEKEAKTKAKDLIDFEMILANASEGRNKTKVGVTTLSNSIKNIDLKKYLEGVGVKSDSAFIYSEKYYKNIDQLLTSQNIPIIKDYLKFHLLNRNATYLTTELNEAYFNFYSKFLEGQEEQLPQDARFIELVENTMGETFGKYYVEKYFSPEAKKQLEIYTDYLKKAFENRINQLDWMTDETKRNAIAKLTKIKINIGYPAHWKDYSDLIISSPEEGATLYSNMNNYEQWVYKNKRAKIGQPLDKSEWLNVPQVVTAFYRPDINEMFFAAAYLQPPVFNTTADPAINFGAIGSIIGHELSHAFDNNGANYDGDGNRTNWWTAEDKMAFDKKVEALAIQYDQFEPLKGYFINGKLTSGENIGDLGGVAVAYDALQLYLNDFGDPGLIDGLSQPERFFISFAAGNKDKGTEQFIKYMLKTNPHPPGYYRVIGPLSNLDAFIETFQIKPGDKMYKSPAERIKIW